MPSPLKEQGFIAADTGAVGSVATWHCDENAHMNVRFYVQAFDDAVMTLAIRMGLKPSELRAVDYHIRFHRELRAGAGWRVHYHLRRVESESGVRMLLWLGNDFVPLAATCVASIIRTDDKGQTVPCGEAATTRASQLVRAGEMPALASARGIPPTPPRALPTTDDVARHQPVLISRAPVTADEIDINGFLTAAHYIGRVSDGIPNLISQGRGEDRATEVRKNRGGAAVEYRIVQRNAAHIDTVLSLYAGMIDVNPSIMRWGHWMFEEDTGRCIATSEAIAVPLDLKKRRAIKMSATQVAEMQQMCISEMGA